MWSDFRAFGIAPSFVTTGGATLSADTNPQGTIIGFIHILALSDLVITDLVLRYPKQGTVSATALSLPAGAQLLAVASCTIVSGTGQVFYFKG